jgi:thioredoxin reductase (NADPH)
MPPLSVDLAVIGAGPAGLYAAYYAGFRGLSVALVDALPEPGGQVSALYPEKLIYDIAGFPAVKGRDLVENLVAQAGRFAPSYVLGEQAESCVRGDDGRLLVTTDKGTEIACGAVVITGGIGSFTPRPLPLGQQYEGRGLSYFVPRLEAHRDQDVVVVGGGDSAFDWAASLEPIARSVTLVHRRETFRAHEHTVSQVKASRVELITSAAISGVSGDVNVESVDVLHLPTKTTRTVKTQAIVAALGFTADLGPLETWGIAARDRRILVDTRMQTSVPGVFAAGDITEYDGKVRLISVGFGEAATAVNNAAVLLRPDLDLFPGHSSDSVV